MIDRSTQASSASESRPPPEKKPRIELDDGVEKSDGESTMISTASAPGSHAAGCLCAVCELGTHDLDCGCDICEELAKLEAEDEAEDMVSEEDYIAYREQIDKSDGYDVDDFQGMTNQGGIQPVEYFPEHFIQLCTGFVNQAVQVYNQNNAAQIQYVKIIKVNIEFSFCTPRAYITFEANDGDASDPKIYQTRVRRTPERDIVEQVRRKPEVN